MILYQNISSHESKLFYAKQSMAVPGADRCTDRPEPGELHGAAVPGIRLLSSSTGMYPKTVTTWGCEATAFLGVPPVILRS